MINLILTFFFFWLLVLTLFFIKLKNHYLHLTTKTRKETLDEILEELLKNEQIIQNNLESLKKQLSDIIEKSKYHFQRYGIVRFNPFERVAGEQSFVIALLDKEENGYTLNFIYTKEGLRVYPKEIIKGQGVNIELSEEEKKAIKQSKIKVNS
ncbi:MAG: DUF4446 family protein [Microgenomates group bacterium]